MSGLYIAGGVAGLVLVVLLLAAHVPAPPVRHPYRADIPEDWWG